MDMDASAIPWKYLHGTLKTAVGYHQAILDITSEMETSFSKLLLVAFLDTIIMICISIYHASKVVFYSIFLCCTNMAIYFLFLDSK